MNKNNQYLTEPKISQQNKQKTLLRKYVDSIDDKIKNAKWKQDLVLSYNYVPLQDIKDKMQCDKKNYCNKIKAAEHQLAKQLKNNQTQRQNQIFKDFDNKLKNKIQQIQILISEQQMKISILSAETADKRMILRDTMRDNMYIGQSVMKRGQQQYEQDVHDAQNIAVVLRRSSSMKTKLNNLPMLHKNSRLSTRIASQSSRVTDYRDTYSQCLDITIRALRQMQSSEDVQQGIFLDIMHRKKQRPLPRYSLKSTICDTLMSRYKKLQTKSTPNKQSQSDFYMGWDTFKGLNWKQIMGIVLVKDPSADKIRKLLQSSV